MTGAEHIQSGTGIAYRRDRVTVLLCGSGLFANGVPRKTADHDVLAEFGDLQCNQILNGLIRILDECLIQQTDAAKKFVDFSFHDFLDDVSRFTNHLCAINVPFPFNGLSGNLIPAHVQRMRSSNVECDILDEVAEILVFRHEIGFAVYFNENAYFSL